MKMAVPRKAAPPSAPTKAQSMSENCSARNSDRKEGGQVRRRRSEICGETRKGKPGETGMEGALRRGRSKLHQTKTAARKRKGSGPPGRSPWPPCRNL